MKKLLVILLCVLMIAGCAAKSKSVPIKDGCFDITVSELVEKVDKLSEGRGVPKLSEVKSIEIPSLESREGEGAKSYQTGEDTGVGLYYNKESGTVSEINLLSSISGTQEDAALQMGQYLAAFSRTLSPDAKLDFDVGAVVASRKATVYTEDNFKIYINSETSALLIKILPNE